ncbi:hypothetical protein M758_9G022300 [Ceratodon purpureus]|uniref:Uncharacterized protein n=1 Tax=Ceratodon purpureus TaxID=3225 RepID=A0A8T0GR22_CERPU|nr:hypothetical protein KC19_9G021900 [Ceratodon purpureus]KAG0604962.1 hypothetical protein M758_9G022300 [Ceratodon purpureus]
MGMICSRLHEIARIVLRGWGFGVYLRRAIHWVAGLTTLRQSFNFGGFVWRETSLHPRCIPTEASPGTNVLPVHWS